MTITLNPDYCSGKEFVIETIGNTTENDYIQSLELNGSKLKSVQLTFDSVAKGGTLKVMLGAEPNTRITK